MKTNELTIGQLICIIIGFTIIGFVIGITWQNNVSYSECMQVIHQLNCTIPILL